MDKLKSAEEFKQVRLMNHAFGLIGLERARQELLKLQGKFDWTCAELDPSNVEKLVVLAEEFGEVSKESCELMRGNGDKAKLKAELVQVAAVCVAWIASLREEEEELLR